MSKCPMAEDGKYCPYCEVRDLREELAALRQSPMSQLRSGGELDELRALQRNLDGWIAESKGNSRVDPLERLVGYIAARLEAYA